MCTRRVELSAMYPTASTDATHGTATQDTQQTLAGALLTGVLPLAMLAVVTAPGAATAATLATLAALGAKRVATNPDGADDIGPPGDDNLGGGQTPAAPAGD